MSKKPSYEELVNTIARLEQEAFINQQLQKTVRLQEESLKESEERYWTIFEQAPVGIVFEDLFKVDDIQRLQDEFAKATGVSLIRRYSHYTAK